MASKNANLWLGLGLGAIIGAVAYRLSETSKAQQLKTKAMRAFHKTGDHVEDFMEKVEDKALNMGVKTADKVADKTHMMANKLDGVKDRVHDFAENVRMK